jgi:hypothetical protein
MEPLPESKYWVHSDTRAIDSDPDTATLVLRLELAINSLVVQMHSGVRTTEGAQTAIEMRALMHSFLATASYTKEAINILNGVRGVPGEFQRVATLAKIVDVPDVLSRKISRLCDGTHPASPILSKLRNKLVFHWEPDALRESLLNFVPNERVIWAESPGGTLEQLVHRLGIEVLSRAILPEDPAPPTDPDERALRDEQRFTSAVVLVVDAARAIVAYFECAVVGYFKQVGVTIERLPSLDITVGKYGPTT